MTEAVRSDIETRPKSARPISHWLLAIGGILLVVGEFIDWSESFYSQEHAVSSTHFGTFFASFGAILLLIAILVELFSIGSCIRRIEARLKLAE